jgi:hypothetical protein
LAVAAGGGSAAGAAIVMCSMARGGRLDDGAFGI